VNNALLVGLSRQMVLSRELDSVANNLANLSTTGFKGGGMVFQEYLSPTARVRGATSADRRLSYVEDSGAYTDFAKGPVETTGNPLDLAIDGDAFLTVETARGERYTRNGALGLDATGKLVTASGDAVLTTSGPISFSAQDGAITIAADGTISTDQGQRGRLRLVRFDSPQRLRREGNSEFSSSAPPVELAVGAVRLVQGALEKSNVRPIVETTRLIEITRAYQSVSNMLQSGAELRRSAIQQLSELPN